MKKIHYVYLFYVLIFSLVYFLTLNINYVEGDDASTILYHLCGRDKNIQNPYALYNSGFDLILSFLPNNEVFLREFSFLISFIFGFLVLFLSAFFIDLLFDEQKTNLKYYFLALLPFIIPEYIFNSLVLNSTSIGFVFALLSLILMKLFLNNYHKKLYFILSILFIAIGISFRWSIIMFYPFFYSLLILNYIQSGKFTLKDIKILFIHNLSSIVIALFLIYLSGYNPSNFIEIIIWGNSYVKDNSIPKLVIFATANSFFTIPVIILLIFSLISIFIKKNNPNKKYFLFFIGVSISPNFILGFFPSFKFLITILPLILVFLYYGFLEINKNKFLKFSFYLSILFIWFIGIKVDANGTMYGDGFGFKISTLKNSSENNLDERVKINNVKPSFDGGFYMPTLEGPRPLNGYFYVVFGGQWYKNINNFTNVRYNIIDTLIKNKKFILIQDRKTSYLQCDLYKYGYKTNSIFKNDLKSNINYRLFINNTDTIKILVIPEGINKSKFINNFIQKNTKVIFRSSYSSLILSNTNQDAKIIDPYTLIKNK